MFGTVSILIGVLLDADQMKARHRVRWERCFSDDDQCFQAEDRWMLATRQLSQLWGATAICIAVGAWAAYNRRWSDL